MVLKKHQENWKFPPFKFQFYNFQVFFIFNFLCDQFYVCCIFIFFLHNFMF